MKTALAISGSGAACILTTGYLKAIQDLKIEYDYIIASSSGVFPAAFLCSGQIDFLADFMLKIMDHDVFSLAVYKLLTKELSVLNDAPFMETIFKKLDFPALQASKVPCIVTSTDTTNWTTIHTDLRTCIDVIDCSRRMRDSGSLPFLFPYRNNRLDGGLVDNYPVFDETLPGIERIIWLVSAAPHPKPITNIYELLMVTIDLLLYGQQLQVQRAIQLYKPHVEVITVAPKKPTGIDVINFSGIQNRQEILDLGRQLVEEALSK